jgi:hypothetical protein
LSSIWEKTYPESPLKKSKATNSETPRTNPNHPDPKKAHSKPSAKKKDYLSMLMHTLWKLWQRFIAPFTIKSPLHTTHSQQNTSSIPEPAKHSRFKHRNYFKKYKHSAHHPRTKNR